MSSEPNAQYIHLGSVDGFVQCTGQPLFFWGESKLLILCKSFDTLAVSSVDPSSMTSSYMRVGLCDALRMTALYTGRVVGRDDDGDSLSDSCGLSFWRDAERLRGRPPRGAVAVR
jgi:hypothetical protein